jgi:hypothetical protein
MSECCPSNDWAAMLARREELTGRGAETPRADASSAAREPRPRRLLLCLDGVPFDVVTEAKRRGLFDTFRAPSRLLSPFPTMTNVALAQMFRATPPPGYESLYFDRDERRLSGGVRKYLGRRTPDKIPSSYMDELDYQEPLAFEFLIYVATERVWQADMRRFRERFLSAPPTRDFFGFLKATDGLLHKCGPERLHVALRSLDQILRGIQQTCGSETEIVLFSDHGMNLQDNRRVHMQTHLTARGFQLTDDLRTRGPRPRLSTPAFGLCSFASVYCADGSDATEVCEALSSLEGVDFSVRRDEGDGVFVHGASGRARIRRRESAAGEVAYSYERADGDPLELAGAVSALREAGEMDDEGFASDAAWLARTAGHAYPDAPSNIHGSLLAPRVRHTADVLVSLRDGYYYGASAFGRFVTLRATHGNALRQSTSAFLMSTHREFPAHVRAAEARPFLRG